MDFNEIFAKEDKFQHKFRDVELIHTIREPTTEERLSFSKATAKTNYDQQRSGTLTTSMDDAALLAPMKLYDKLIKSVEVIKGDEREFLQPEQIKDFIPQDVKLAVIGAWQNRVRVREADAMGN